MALAALNGSILLPVLFPDSNSEIMKLFCLSEKIVLFFFPLRDHPFLKQVSWNADSVWLSTLRGRFIAQRLCILSPYMNLAWSFKHSQACSYSYQVADVDLKPQMKKKIENNHLLESQRWPFVFFLWWEMTHVSILSIWNNNHQSNKPAHKNFTTSYDTMLHMNTTSYDTISCELDNVRQKCIIYNRI